MMGGTVVRSTPAVTNKFVGRDRELKELKTALNDAADGRGRVVMLTGEPGIGKTRLAGELSAEATRRGLKVAWGRCWAGGGVPAFWPWIEIIRTSVRECEPADLRALMGAGAAYVAQLVPELRDTVTESASPLLLDLETDQARFRLFDAVSSFLARMSETQPSLIVLDDLHAVDPPSLLLLQFLTRRIGTARLLIIGTYREVEARTSPAVARILGAMARDSVRLSLPRLNKEEVGKFIKATLTNTPTPAEAEALTAAVYRATEGNPFFVQETIRFLMERHSESFARCGSELRIPDQVRDVIRCRLELLPEETKQVLLVAAVIGRDFDLAVLKRASERSASRLPERLSEAAAHDLIMSVPDSPQLYTFSHNLIRQTLYDDASPTSRADTHRRVGETLEALSGSDRPGRSAELAHHFHEALLGESHEPLGRAATPSGWHKALRYMKQAASQAMKQLAYEEAVSFYDRALRLGDRWLTKVQRAGLLLDLGEAQDRAGEAAAARKTFLEVVEVVRGLKTPELLARAALGYANTTISWPNRQGDLTLLRLLENALRALDESDSELRTLVLAELGLHSSFCRESARSPLALTSASVEMAERLANPKVLGRALRCRHSSLWSLSDPESLDERIAVAKRLIEIANASGLGELEFYGHLFLLLDVWEIGQAQAVDAELQICVRLSDALRQPRLTLIATWLRAIITLSRGRLEEAEHLAHEALAKAEEANDPDVAAYFGPFMFSLHDLRGQLAQFEVGLRAHSERFVGPEHLGLRCALLYAKAEAGDLVAARQGLEELALLGFPNLFANPERMVGLAQLVRIAAATAAVEHGAELYDLLLPYAARNILLGGPVTLYFGPVEHALGLLAVLLGRPEDAVAHFEQAARMELVLGARPYLARTRFEHARALLCRGEAGDRESARRLLTQVVQDAKGMGMAGLAAKAEAQLDELAGNATGGPHHGANEMIQRRGPPKREPERATVEVVHPGRSAGLSPSDRVAAGRECVFRSEGQFWSVGDPANPIRLRDSKGLRCLHHLIRHPGREMHVMELVDLISPPDTEQTAGRTREVLRAIADTPLDAPARRAYVERLRDLREDLSEAESLNDLGRIERAQGEIEFLSHELSIAVGLRGRRRRAGSPVEQARVSVTKLINRTIQGIAAYDSPLGQWLKLTVRTGTFCSYRPDPYAPIRWQL
jgi:tetratricopeptide (TPR) repeat protein